MQRLCLTCDTPEANLAMDEALLESAEVSDWPNETLRLWESPSDALILGRASKYAEESHTEQCNRDGIPILRRSSGGASVMIGPGCLMYAVVLSYEQKPFLRQLDQAHQYVMDHLVTALKSLAIPVVSKGTCDLTLNDRKFSGNSLRCKKKHLLYHGTLLYDYELSKIQRYLDTPPRQPEYRLNRTHEDFVINLPCTRSELEKSLLESWGADQELIDVPHSLSAELQRTKYDSQEWHRRL